MQESLPSRERGLKSVLSTEIQRLFVSLPSRERGLKFVGVKAAIELIGRSLHGSVD